eukprot:1329765-Pyramimonas_sp.AAC.1
MAATQAGCETKSPKRSGSECAQSLQMRIQRASLCLHGYESMVSVHVYERLLAAPARHALGTHATAPRSVAA